MASTDFKIISMNLTKAGHKPMAYLRELLDTERPELCLLPGNNDDKNPIVVCGYEQCFTQGTDQIVLLYNAEKIKIIPSTVSGANYGPKPGIDYDVLCCPEVLVEFGPYKETLKVNILAWHPSLTQNNRIDRRTQAESIINLAQKIAMTRNTPVLIGGDFNLDLQSVKKIVKKMSSDGKQWINERAEDSGNYPSDKWTPGMISGSLWPQKDLLSMEVYSCSKLHQVDFFVASKALMLKKTSIIDFESATGKKTNVEKCREHEKPKPTIGGGTTCYQPTKTTISCQPRPPKHSGG